MHKSAQSYAKSYWTLLFWGVPKHPKRVQITPIWALFGPFWGLRIPFLPPSFVPPLVVIDEEYGVQEGCKKGEKVHKRGQNPTRWGKQGLVPENGDDEVPKTPVLGPFWTHFGVHKYTICM